MIIRDATAADVPHILAIYNEVVENTFAIYDEQASTLEERHGWFEARRAAGLPVLIADEGGAVVGFSSFGEWRSRWGYRYTVEHSVHVRADCRGRGLGRQLIEALFPRASSLGKHVMIGHIDSLALASLHLHSRLGFQIIGTFRQVAQKADRWLDVVAVQRYV